MKKVFQGLKGAATKQVGNARKTIMDPNARANALSSAASIITAERLEALAHKTLGKERTAKITKTANDAYGRVDKTLGEGRLKAATDSGLYVLTTMPVAGKALGPLVLTSVVAGYCTKSNAPKDLADVFFGSSNAASKTAEGTSPAPLDGTAKTDAPKPAAPADPAKATKKAKGSAPKPPQA